MADVAVDDLIGMELEVYDRAMKGVLAVDEYDNPILCDGEPLFTPDLPSANRALENIARLCGFMVERREVMVRTLAGTADVVMLHAVDGGKGGDSA